MSSENSAASTAGRRVDATAAALALLQELADEHGPLMLHQSGGCCDGSAPMCFPRDEFTIGDGDVLLGVLGSGASETPVWISGPQFRYWSHTRLTIDVVPGRGAGFSVEAPRGVRFLVRSRLFTSDESAAVEAFGPPQLGPASYAAAPRSDHDDSHDQPRVSGPS